MCNELELVKNTSNITFLLLTTTALDLETSFDETIISLRHITNTVSACQFGNLKETVVGVFSVRIKNRVVKMDFYDDEIGSLDVPNTLNFELKEDEVLRIDYDGVYHFSAVKMINGSLLGGASCT